MINKFRFIRQKQSDIFCAAHLLWAVFLCLLSALQLISICYFIVKLLPEPVINKCKTMASNLNDIYLAQWIIIHWVVGFALKGIFDTDLTTGVTLLITTAITAASVIAGYFMGKRRKKALEIIYNKPEAKSE